MINFDEVLQLENVDEWGNTLKPPGPPPRRRRSSRKSKKLRTGVANHLSASDKDDNNFEKSSSETESVESGDFSQVSNEEVCRI
jgi:hypothetical protein